MCYPLSQVLHFNNKVVASAVTSSVNNVSQIVYTILVNVIYLIENIYKWEYFALRICTGYTDVGYPNIMTLVFTVLTYIGVFIGI